MAGRSRTLQFVFSGDDRDLKRAFRSINGDVDNVGHKVARFAKVGAAGMAAFGTAAAAGLLVAGKAATDTASDINESLSKNQVLFGKQSKEIERFAATSAKSFGISKRAALDATGTFGNLFVALDIGPKKAAGMSVGLTKLAADLASFNNASPEDALEAIRSGLVGETEPLRRFGVNLSDANLRQEALRQGLVKTTKEALTPQQKALAVNALLYRQTSKAQGDFARTSDQNANQQRILKASLEDVSASAGRIFLPAVNKVARELNKTVVPAMKSTADAAFEIFGTSNDLSLSEKFARTFDVAKVEFRPLTNKFTAELERADLGEKFANAFDAAAPKIADAAAAAAPRAAGAFVRAFTGAGPWGQLITVAFLAKKMGAFSAAGGIAADTFMGTFRKGTANAPVGAPAAAAARGSALGPLGLLAGVGVAGAIASRDEFKGLSKGAKSMVEDARKMGGGSLEAAERVDKLRASLEKLGARTGPFAKDARQAARAIDTINRPALDVRRAIDRMAKGTEDSIASLRTNIRLNMRLISRNLGEGSEEAKIALSRNFNAAIETVKRSMEAGTISVRDGTREINRLLRENLRNFGITGDAARNYLKDGRDSAGKPLAGPGGHAMGGLIGGQGRGDIVPAMLEPGEFVIRRKVVERFGPTFFASLNRSGGVQRFQGGGIVALGHELQGEGYQVGEHPAFGGVHPVHTKGSYHYKGLALDVNADGRGQAYENQRLDALYSRLKGKPGIAELLWRTKGHFDHLHVAFTGAGDPLSGSPSGGGMASAGPTRQELRERAASRFDSKVIRPIIRKFQGPLTKLGRESAGLGASVDGSDRALSRLERRNDLTDEDLGDPTQQVNRLFELSGLTRFQQNRITLAKRQAAVKRKEIAKYRRLIRELKAAAKKAPPGARGPLNKRLKDYQDRILTLKSDLRTLGEFVEDREDDIADLGKQTQEVLDAEPTKAFDSLSSALEDIDLREGAGELTAAQANEQRGIARAGFLFGKFGAFTEHQRLQVVGDARSASESSAAEDRSGELIDAMNGLRAQLAENNAAAAAIAGTVHETAIKALAYHVDGYVTAGWNQRRQSAGNGTGANY